MSHQTGIQGKQALIHYFISMLAFHLHARINASPCERVCVDLACSLSRCSCEHVRV